MLSIRKSHIYYNNIPLTVGPPFNGGFRQFNSYEPGTSTCAQRFRQERLIATIRFSAQPKEISFSDPLLFTITISGAREHLALIGG